MRASCMGVHEHAALHGEARARTHARTRRLHTSAATSLFPLYLQRSGNGKLSLGVKSKNKAYVRESLKLYTDGINEKCSDAKLNSVLFSNRAHVESLLGEAKEARAESARTEYACAVHAHARCTVVHGSARCAAVRACVPAPTPAAPLP
jgi:hypothetical protein